MLSFFLHTVRKAWLDLYRLCRLFLSFKVNVIVSFCSALSLFVVYFALVVKDVILTRSKTSSCPVKLPSLLSDKLKFCVELWISREHTLENISRVSDLYV